MRCQFFSVDNALTGQGKPVDGGLEVGRGNRQPSFVNRKILPRLTFDEWRFTFAPQCFLSFCMILSVQASRMAEARNVM